MSRKSPPADPLKAHEALEKLLAAYDFRSVLDVGCGPGRHSAILRQAGKEVTGIDFVKMCDDVIVANYLHHEFDRQFDCLWLSHVLEHQINVNQFLQKVFRDLKPGGILAVTVPPLKHQIVGGHVTLWNAGLLLYNLILAGFDCRRARVKHYGYNISVLVPKLAAAVPYERLHFDRGDIELVSSFFPEHPQMKWEHSFRGDIAQLNWDGDELLFDQPRRKSVLRFLSPGYWRAKRAA
jgi:SAM-dependent methyltransferase